MYNKQLFEACVCELEQSIAINLSFLSMCNKNPDSPGHREDEKRYLRNIRDALSDLAMLGHFGKEVQFKVTGHTLAHTPHAHGNSSYLEMLKNHQKNFNQEK